MSLGADVVLYDKDGHRCVAFSSLVRGDDGVQANQFLVQDNGESAVLDPGGALLYNPLVLALSRHMQPHEMRWVLCSHQDPDIIGSVDKWLLYTQATIVCSKLWGRFVPHVVPGYMTPAPSATCSCRTKAATSRWVATAFARCRAISCIRSATSASTIRSAASCSPATSARR